MLWKGMMFHAYTFHLRQTSWEVRPRVGVKIRRTLQVSVSATIFHVRLTYTTCCGRRRKLNGCEKRRFLGARVDFFSCLTWPFVYASRGTIFVLWILSRLNVSRLVLPLSESLYLTFEADPLYGWLAPSLAAFFSGYFGGEFVQNASRYCSGCVPA